MTTENQSLATVTQQLPTVPADVSAMALQSALAGDLKRLTADDRLKFYGALCQFTGLNPLSKPFDWLELQGKLVLYANKGCAEQLRKIHGVKIEILERKAEFGCLIVRVRATDAANRTDESIGVVPFDDRMSPLDKANAMMKSETKAKRRVSLSICGLGMLDESELDTVRELRRADAAAAIVSGVETGSDRAAALNQALEVEVVGTASETTAETEQASAPPNTTTANPPPAPVATKPAPAPAPAAAPTPAPVKPATTTTAPAPQPGSLKGPDGKLSEETVLSLQAALTGKDVVQCLNYLVAKGKLRRVTKQIEHEDGTINSMEVPESLENLDPVAANFILKKPRQFFTMVDEWMKTQTAQQ